MIDLISHFLNLTYKKSESDIEDILRNYQNNDFTKVVYAPRVNEKAFLFSKEEIKEHVKIYRDIMKLKGINVEIYPSSLMLLTDKMIRKLFFGKILTLNETRYIPVEFLSNISLKKNIKMLSKMVKKGYIPIINHVECYDILENNLDNVIKLKETGAKIAISLKNVDFFDTIEEEFFLEILQSNLADCIVTDYFRDNNIKNFKSIFEYLRYFVDYENLQDKLYKNPLKILKNELF